MLHLPEDNSDLLTIVGFDPGTNTFGISVLSVNIETMKIVSSNAWTIRGERLAGKNSWMEERHGGRVSRLMAIEENLLQLFNYYKPTLIASESPFINNSFPQAGIALTEVICTVRRAVMLYDIWKELYLIPPSSVKNAIGAPGNADKIKVKEKVLELKDLNYCGDVPIENLDEHSLDALAVAYCRYKSLIV